MRVLTFLAVKPWGAHRSIRCPASTNSSQLSAGQSRTERRSTVNTLPRRLDRPGIGTQTGRAAEHHSAFKLHRRLHFRKRRRGWVGGDRKRRSGNGKQHGTGFRFWSRERRIGGKRGLAGRKTRQSHQPIQLLEPGKRRRSWDWRRSKNTRAAKIPQHFPASLAERSIRLGQPMDNRARRVSPALQPAAGIFVRIEPCCCWRRSSESVDILPEMTILLLSNCH